MTKISKGTAERISKNIPLFQKVLESARVRDVNESDTVTIVTDMLANIFGYDKYSEITSEQAIRGTFCDLAVKLDNKIRYLVEVKAIGLELKEGHLRQAINYGANEGVSWVILTNGLRWDIYKIIFEQPVSYDLVFSLDFGAMNSKKKDDFDKVYLLCKDAVSKEKSAIEEFHEYSKIVNRYTIASIILTDSVISVIKRELKRLSPNAKFVGDEVEKLLPDILKRDVLEGDDAEKAAKLVKKAANKQIRKVSKKEDTVAEGERLLASSPENEATETNVDEIEEDISETSIDEVVN